MKDPADKVIAAAIMSYPEYFEPYIEMADVVSVELIDTAQNIFDRLIFTDENDVVYEDNEYKNAHRAYYLREIEESQRWYGGCFRNVEVTVDIEGLSAEEAAMKVIEECEL